MKILLQSVFAVVEKTQQLRGIGETGISMSIMGIEGILGRKESSFLEIIIRRICNSCFVVW